MHVSAGQLSPDSWAHLVAARSAPQSPITDQRKAWQGRSYVQLQDSKDPYPANASWELRLATGEGVGNCSYKSNNGRAFGGVVHKTSRRFSHAQTAQQVTLHDLTSSFVELRIQYLRP